MSGQRQTGREKPRMKKKKAYCLQALGILLSIVATSSFAVCDLKELKTGTVSFGNIVAQRDTPVGSVLAEIHFAWSTPSVSCGGSFTRFRTFSYQGGVLSSLRHTYKTNLAGVGVTTAAYSLFSNPPEIFSGVGGVAGNHHDVVIQLIKIGDITAGTLATGEIATEKFSPIIESTPGPAAITAEAITMGAGNIITTLACSLNSTSINVPLGDVAATKFTGIATTAGDKSFDLGLTCDKDAKINVSLAGTQNTDTSETSVLALTSAGQTGTASGVGVQLLYGGTPLKINNNILLKSSAGGQETLPFTARYYQTLADISAGLANSSATLNITYQ
ncbi:type 1 fimbrial protein [Serratia proteamaculans]|uniref:fimbrial protein n=1 Tax=Serratia proteamaculans TaxID=28151 RepID=UPI001575C87E|nr:fimbrial protein [Serratia proteamaculans]NTX82074.1 type 1 fimbrial protein [Serratia proteamaculans]NTZ31276.1 type 1 fimbrial protein [Serratia proteamaculans]